jgi:hypothetical protein
MTSIIKVDNLQNQCGANIISESANVITIGASGDTVTLAAGASQSGFGRSGSVNWDTTPKTSSPVTAVSGNGYFINTTSIAITVNLPSTPAAGDIVAIADYANTSATNNITVGRNGSLIDGEAINAKIKINGQVYTLVYVDATEGWKTVNQTFNQINTAEFVAATGGTITTCGDYKIHSFTGPGTFTVTNAGNPIGSSTVDYLVVAGGGTGGSPGATGYESGGGGAGGLRTGTSFPISVTTFPITVGAGGVGSPSGGGSGNQSIFSTITSAGGGSGGPVNTGPSLDGAPGGSGGGSSQGGPGVGLGGTGNTPPVAPPQGNPGGQSTTPARGGGGGGSSTAGGGGAAPTAGIGGSGTDVTPIFGAAPKPFYIADGPNAGPSSGGIFAGGGGGSTPGQAGGPGGGANGSPGIPGYAGIANTGGGGGGITTPAPPSAAGGSGGSGIVLIKYKYQ